MPVITEETTPPVKKSSSQKTQVSKRKSSSQKPPAQANELPFHDVEKAEQAGSAKNQKKRKTTKTQTPSQPEKHGIKMQIAQMAIQGLSPSEIASKLGISIAEVDLALQLLNLPK